MNHLTPGTTRYWVNGLESESVSAADRGLHYGDGVFETLRIRCGAPRFLALHWQRLQEGCERLQIPAMDFAALEAQLLAAAALVDDGIAKLIVTRGPSAHRGYAPPPMTAPTCVLVVAAGITPWPASACVEFSAVTLGENPLLAGLKHLNRLENVLARARQPAHCDEVLMRTSAGAVICGSGSNIFAVRTGQLLTPRLDRCGVAGVVRSVVLREAAAAGLDCMITTLLPDDLYSADELFLTNARIGILPIGRLGVQLRDIGPITVALQARVERL